MNNLFNLASKVIQNGVYETYKVITNKGAVSVEAVSLCDFLDAFNGMCPGNDIKIFKIMLDSYNCM